MERRQNNGERCKIVQQFVMEIRDDKMRLACWMYMRNCDDRGVCKQLKITQEQLEMMKLQLAIELRKAGIRL